MSGASPEHSAQPPEGSAPPEPEFAEQRAAGFVQVLLELTPRVYVTRAIITINVAVFVLGVASGVSPMNPTTEQLLKWGANFGPNVLAGEWWRILTCTFIHIGLIHIALNMFVLAAVGPLVERMVGNAGFLVLYLVAGVCGSLTSLCYHPLVVSAGASGAVFGVYGALIAVLRQKAGAVPQAELTRIRKAGMAFVGYNLVFGFMLSGIDNAAHIGGLVAGFLCGLVLNLPLAPESRTRRPGRTVLAAMVGLVLVVAGVILADALYGDLPAASAELDRTVELEKRLVEVSESSRRRAQRGELSDAAFADVIERDLLPEWRASADDLARYRRVPASLRATLDELVKYMRVRQEAMALEVQALREGDERKMQRAEQLHGRANEMAKQVNPPDK